MSRAAICGIMRAIQYSHYREVTAMSFFISDAMAAADAAGQPGLLESMIFPLGLVVILYFFMIRPQMKRQKAHRQLVEALKKGDEVQTDSGMYGRVTDIDDDSVKIELAEGVIVRFRRQSVSVVLPKGTLKEK